MILLTSSHYTGRRFGSSLSPRIIFTLPPSLCAPAWFPVAVEHEEDITMSSDIERSFQTLLDNCGVDDQFQDFLRDNTIFNQTRFLAAVPRSIDEDLIAEFRNAGHRPKIGDLVNIRMVFTLCKDADAAEKSARAAVKASPDTATIPDHDKRLLRDMFFQKHGWHIVEKKLPCTDLINQLFHQLTSTPKALKFYLPSQLRLAGSGPLVVGTSLNFNRDGSATGLSEIHAPEDFSDSIAFYRTIRAFFHTISYVTIADPKFLPYNIGDDFADQLLVWMSAKYGGNHKNSGQRLPLKHFLQAFISTMTHFVDRINNGDDGRGESLAVLISREEYYRQFWTMYSDNKVGSSSSGSTVLHPDPTGDVKRQLQKVQEQNSRLKQNFDRLQSDHRRLSAPVFQPVTALPGTHPVGRGGSGGSGGGGGGGGRDNTRGAISRKRTRDQQQQQQPQHNDKNGGDPRGTRRGGGGGGGLRR